MQAPLRALFNRWRRRLVHAWLYRRVFGERSQGRWLPHTRISPACCIDGDEHLTLHDHVYIGPFCWIEASGGVTLEEGVQVTSHVSIVTHSSHRTMRLMGRAYAERPYGDAGDAAPAGASTASPSAGDPRPGWVAGPVHIGAYSFIGPHVVIEAGSVLGKGCIVRAGSVVRGHFGDHAVLQGQPARVVDDARATDELLLAAHPQWRRAYEAWAGTEPR